MVSFKGTIYSTSIHCLPSHSHVSFNVPFSDSQPKSTTLFCLDHMPIHAHAPNSTLTSGRVNNSRLSNHRCICVNRARAGQFRAGSGVTKFVFMVSQPTGMLILLHRIVCNKIAANSSRPDIYRELSGEGQLTLYLIF